MIITNTYNTSGNTTFLVLADAIFDALVLGTYSALRIVLTNADGTAYTRDITTIDVSVNIGEDDIVTLLPAMTGATGSIFPQSFYTVQVYSGLLFDSLETEACVLTDETLKCEVYQQLIADTTSDYHVRYEALALAGLCNGCDCEVLTQVYTCLINDVASSTISSVNCGC